MTAIIISIGDELLIGQVVNTNASWMGEQLSSVGVDVRRVVTCADEAQEIRRVLEQALPAGDLVFLTGGLGPTIDDLTRYVVADCFGCPLELNPKVMKQVEELFSSRDLPMAASNKSQALIPRGFEVLSNPVGTAAGFHKEWTDGTRRSELFVLPGVPFEMKQMMSAWILPRLSKQVSESRVITRTLQTTGIGESWLATRLGDLSPFLSDEVKLAFLPSIHGVRLRLTAWPERAPDAASRFRGLASHIRDRLGPRLFSDDESTLEMVAGNLLIDQGLTVSIAESCTGGRIADRLTNVPGASTYFLGSVTAYSNQIKTDVLGVSEDCIRTHGAVSREVAVAMAEGIMRTFGSNVGISSTGIMGPDGGTEEKPVGTVWIGYAREAKSSAIKFQFGSDRDRNKSRTATAAINRLRLELTQDDG